MAQQTAPAGSGQGNQNRKPNPNPVNSNKVDIRITPSVVKDVLNKKCDVFIRVKLVKNHQLFIGQEVALEEGLSLINADTTDNDGCVVFQFKENMKDVEQTKPLTVTLTGLVDEKNFFVTIPALPTAKPTDKVMSVNYFVTPDFTTGTCKVNLECQVTENNKAAIGKQVYCKNGGLLIIGTQKTDNSGQAFFNEDVVLRDIGQTITYRFHLVKTGEFVLVNVNVPVIPQPVKIDKKIAVTVAAIPNLKTNLCDITLQCVITDGVKAISGQDIICKRGLALIGTQTSSNSGQVNFSENVALTDAEQIISYRIDLLGSGEFELVDVNLPAGTPAVDTKNLAEKMSMRSYHDGAGNFSVKVRVLAHNGVGIKTKVTTWFLGQLSVDKTSKEGELAYDLPTLTIDKSEKISASVSGIEDEAKLTLKFRRPLICPYIKYTEEWYLRTNNGRAVILSYIFLFFLGLSLVCGIGGPLINPTIFRADNGLSKQEQMHNRVVGHIVPKAKFVAVEKSSSKFYSTFTRILWGTTVMLLVFLMIYGPLSWREEIAEAIAETAESIFENNESHVGDPLLERWAANLGVFHSVRNTPKISVQEVNGQTENTTQAQQPHSNQPTSGHPSLMQMFQMDVLSDALVTILPKVLKKIF